METIGKTEIFSFIDASSRASKATNSAIRGSTGHRVHSYIELARKVAELQFRNPDYVLLFRGQARDYKNQSANTTLKPSIFRAESGQKENPGRECLLNRFSRLTNAEACLSSAYRDRGLLGSKAIVRQRILRWAILQHYEVTDTPLLDVTQSLRIAASFAAIMDSAERQYLFVLGVPNLSGGVTASAEANVQIVRLSSVCPPEALRPHLQEGYLLGEYPEMSGYEQKAIYDHHEIDFGRRLIAKFYFEPREFWRRDTFPRVGRKALYPDKDDALFDLAMGVKRDLNTN